jgi:uncharacterized membrane protein
MAEVSNLALYHEGISDLRLLTEKTRGSGVKFACKVDASPKGPLECEHEVFDFVDYITMKIRTTKGGKAVGQWRFARMAGKASKTRITYTLNYQVPVPVVGGLVDLLFVRRSWKRRVEHSLQNLKDLLEQQEII